MLVVLQERGYIAQEPLSARYILTTFIFELAHRIPKLRRLTALGAPMMRGLAGRVSQSVHLTQENRLKAVMISVYCLFEILIVPSERFSSHLYACLVVDVSDEVETHMFDGGYVCRSVIGP